VQHRNLVLEQMAKHGKLTQTQLEELRKRPLKLDFARQAVPPSPVPHIVRHLQDWLLEWAGQRDRYVYFDGLVVRTTIDSRLQEGANKAVERQMAHLQRLAGRPRTRGGERAMLQAGSSRWTRATDTSARGWGAAIS
jgi:penicillin-binding protein 1A